MMRKRFFQFSDAAQRRRRGTAPADCSRSWLRAIGSRAGSTNFAPRLAFRCRPRRVCGRGGSLRAPCWPRAGWRRGCSRGKGRQPSGRALPRLKRVPSSIRGMPNARKCGDHTARMPASRGAGWLPKRTSSNFREVAHQPTHCSSQSITFRGRPYYWGIGDPIVARTCWCVTKPAKSLGSLPKVCGTTGSVKACWRFETTLLKPGYAIGQLYPVTRLFRLSEGHKYEILVNMQVRGDVGARVVALPIMLGIPKHGTAPSDDKSRKRQARPPTKINASFDGDKEFARLHAEGGANAPRLCAGGNDVTREPGKPRGFGYLLARFRK